jgi:hypothetical protein
LRLEIPLSGPVVPLSETHVYVGSLRSAHVATYADRKQAVQTYGGWRLATVPREMWDCSLFAKPDNDPELAGVDASGRDRAAVMTPEYTQRGHEHESETDEPDR